MKKSTKKSVSALTSIKISDSVPELPGLIPGDSLVRQFLKDLDKINKTKELQKKLRRCEELILFIVTSLRKKQPDHLRQTTAVWILMNILKTDTATTRGMMIAAGVPTVLHEFLQSRNLTRTTQQYASELCFYLCSEDAYAVYPASLQQAAAKDIQALLQRPAPAPASVLDDHDTVVSDVSSSLQQHDALLVPFVPYRISNENMQRMRSLFGEDTDPLRAPEQRRAKAPAQKRARAGVDPLDALSMSAEESDSVSHVTWFGGGSSVESNSPSFDPMAVPFGKTEQNAQGNADKSNEVTKTATISQRHTVVFSADTTPTGPDKLLDVFPSPIPVVVAGQGRNAARAFRPISVPELPRSAKLAGRARLSVDAGAEPTDFDQFTAEIDPLAVNLGISMQASMKRSTTRLQPTARSKSPSGKQTRALHADSLLRDDFIRQLFSSSASVQEITATVRRLQDLLDLLDKDATGHVTWETVARVLLAVAPPHIMRAHVTTFIEAQTDNMKDVVDYRELIISGKVMIVKRYFEGENASSAPMSSWINRQKSLIGDKSTYSWRNHIEWYRERKSKAVIWLMRRAGRAVQYYKGVVVCAQKLKYAGYRALQLDKLLECGFRAKVAFERRLEAEKALIRRCRHAFHWRGVQREALRSLMARGRLELQTVSFEVQKAMPAPPSLQTIYRIYWTRKIAIRWLIQVGQSALSRIDRRFETAVELRALGKKVLAQLEVAIPVQAQLASCGELACAHCYKQDVTLMNLVRIGQEKALVLLVRQELCLQWLLKRAARSQIFANMKETHVAGLKTQAQFTLDLCNRREEAFALLVHRRQNAVRVLAMKVKAFEELSRLGRSLWRYLQRRDDAQSALAKRAKRAIEYSKQLDAAYRRLKFVAQRAFVVTRRLITAYADLREVGYMAKLFSFERNWSAAADNRARIKEEEKRVQAVDRKHETERKGLTVEARWEVELREAFDYLGSADPFAVIEAKKFGEEDPPMELGINGFRRLLADGKILGVPRDQVDEIFIKVDQDRSGLVTFEEVWYWFLVEARRQGQLHRKPISFKVATILPVKQRAIMILMRRFLSKKVDPPSPSSSQRFR